MKCSVIFLAFVLALAPRFVGADPERGETPSTPSDALCLTTPSKTVEIRSFWARPGKKGQNTAAYMVLKNQSGQEGVALIQAQSPICREVQIHTTLEEEIDGHAVKKMRQVERITLPSQQEVALKPGGYHVMLIGLNSNIDVDQDQKIPLTLTFSNHETLNLTLPIQKKPCSCCEEAAKKAAAEKKSA